jgi:hypothetical protein
LNLKLIVLLIGCIYSSNLAFSNPICQQKIPKNKIFQNFLTAKELALKKFSNNKIIAKKADETLSSLITAKSKILSNWVTKRNLTKASEVDIVKQWRSYYAQNFILGKYPNKDQKINTFIKTIIEKLYFKYLPNSEKLRIQSVFKEAKLLALQKIKLFKIKPEVKAQIIKRVSALELYWMKSFETSKFKKQPLEVFSWGVAYDPVANEINMGLEVLQYPNIETLFAVFTHEIGHSFDPCRWGAFFEGNFPFQKVVTCLRSTNSVAAKKRDDSKIDTMIKRGRLSKTLAMALKLNLTCNKIQYPPVGIQADQIPESFADWFSAEVISSSKYLTNTLRVDLCSTKKLNSGSSYPTNQLRLENIYLAHPKIKKKIGFKKKNKYCQI